MQSQGKSRKNQVGNRKAGSRNNRAPLPEEKRLFSATQKRSLTRRSGTQALGVESTSVAAAYSAPVKNSKPRISYGENGKSCRVQHKEFIQNVSGTTAFTIPLFLALNPGLAGTFPWLSNIANNFEQYRVRMMRFCYLTRTGTNIPGSVLMAPDYDASDIAPVSEQIMSNYAEIVEDAPWKDICCVLRPGGMHALGPKKFVRNGLVPGQDLKTTDVGTFILATVDGTAVNWGKLWVEYDVEFFEPQLNPAGSLLASTAQGTNGTNAAFVSAGGLLAGTNIASVVGNVVSLQNLVPGGEYVSFWGASTSAQNATPTAPVGLTAKTFMFCEAIETGVTWTVNAGVTNAQFNLQWSGAVANPFLVFTPITPGPL